MKRKFKIGDKVEVLEEKKQAEVLAVDNDIVTDFPYLARFDNSCARWCREDELELIPPTPKDLLKPGMVVEYVNGEFAMVFENAQNKLFFIASDGMQISVSGYDENLVNDCSDVSISKIYGLRRTEYDLNDISTHCRGLLWERGNLYNAKLVCVESYTSYFTKGKIYEIENGLLYGNRNRKLNSVFKNIAEINVNLLSKFIELVED